jgi:hypothetical protein
MTPKTVTDPDKASVELGVRFSASKDIVVSGIRFYRGPKNAGPHVGHIWTPEGQVLRTVTFPDDDRTGWIEARFTTPLTVRADQRLIASYVAPKGQYAGDVNGFAKPATNGVVTFPRGAGVYSYKIGAVPQNNWLNSNYYVDIVYSLVSQSSPSATPSSTPSSTRPPADNGAPPVTTGPGTGSSLALPRVPWWGGPSYYGKFSKAAASGWTNSSFFPIAVFYGKPSQAPALAQAGINTYMGAEHDGSPIGMVTNTGISVLAQDEWSRSEVGDDARVVGWHVSDECEMGEGCNGSTEQARLAQQKQMAASLTFNDGRFLQSNFGNGVLGTYWASSTMAQQVGTVDVSSVDKYAYSSPAVDFVMNQSWNWTSGKNPASSSAYGWLQDRMETYSSPTASKPNWVFVETAKPYLTESGARTIQPDQIEGAVWNAIIHGAAGISYFQHNNNGCGNYSILECGATLTNKITSIDAQVTRLAPVINTQSYVWNFGPGLATSLKTSGGYAYIFAMTDGSTGSKTFTLPAGVSGNVEVVDENRTIAVSGGKFTDSFPAEYTHHIYRIAVN